MVRVAGVEPTASWTRTTLIAPQQRHNQLTKLSQKSTESLDMSYFLYFYYTILPPPMQ